MNQESEITRKDWNNRAGVIVLSESEKGINWRQAAKSVPTPC